MTRRPHLQIVLVVVTSALAAACAVIQPTVPARSEIVFASTGRNELISVNAGLPSVVLTRVPVSGLQAGERLAGIDFRPANGKLYGLGTTLRLYTIDPASGAAAQVGSAPLALRLAGSEFGFDFNPVVDRIRLVTDRGENLRVHPDTGAVVDSEPGQPGIQIDVPLRYDDEDPHSGRPAHVNAVAYTNSGTRVPPKTTTNFAIDARLGQLVTLGTREGLSPAFAPATPNTGKLYTIGSLGVQPDGPVSFDIASGANSGARDGTAFAAFIPLGRSTASLYQINLASGAATELGVIDRGEPVSGIAIQP